jgi:hypothetical protein
MHVTVRNEVGLHLSKNLVTSLTISRKISVVLLLGALRGSSSLLHKDFLGTPLLGFAL